MMPCNFTALDGSIQEFDLDSVIDVVLGYSAHRQNWTATVVFDPARGSFVELRSAPPDYRGNSAEEAEEVSDQYIRDAFQFNATQLDEARRAPAKWILVNRRNNRGQ